MKLFSRLRIKVSTFFKAMQLERRMEQAALKVLKFQKLNYNLSRLIGNPNGGLPKIHKH